jgi:RimJ/RimL family protein N-acetyltransferase
MTPPLATAPVLVTERLILRGHTAADLAGCLALWTDPGVTPFLGGNASEQEVWNRLLRYAGMWSLLGYGYWAVTDRKNGDFLGEAGLADMKREMTPPLGAVPESGWSLRAHVHGRGLAHEAMQAVLNWADKQLSHLQTCCIISPTNAPSLRLAEKLGYQASDARQLGDKPMLVLHRARPDTQANVNSAGE